MKRDDCFERLGREIQYDRAKRMCLDKREFPTRNEARDFAARGERKMHHTKQKPYRCLLCGKYHLATVRKARK